jgi:glucosamine--fructose-6-phosphate aminotransferase (isomerizing)
LFFQFKRLVEGKMHGGSSSIAGKHTLSEILSQPEVWPAALQEISQRAAFQELLAEAGARYDWLFVGCGTSFYLAEAAACAWRVLSGGQARALPASEILLFPQLSQLDSENTQAVIISRSGRTSEAVRAAEVLSRTHGILTLGLTCSPDSELAAICDRTFALSAADEQSLVMTRSFTTMFLALVQLGAARSANGAILAAIESAAASLATRIQRFNTQIESFATGQEFEDFVYLAQGPLFPAAREAALKITEMSCSYAQAYHTLEFRHGPKSIVSPRTCLTFLLSESGMKAECEVLSEMKELGGKIIAVCNRAPEVVERSADLLFECENDLPEIVFPAPFIVPAQLLGLHYGLKKGLNPDEPKNLSRVVILD